MDNNGQITQADVLEQKRTYPFGMFAFGYRAAGYDPDRTDFTGHQAVGSTTDRYHASMDMQARYYSPGMASFVGVDPLADQFPSYTPYHYVHNNPINLIDPTGMSAVGYTDTSWGSSSRGKADSRDGSETTIVEDNGDGTYSVTGFVDDRSTDVVTSDGTKVGESLTTHSFVDEHGNAVVGSIIDPSSMAGQDFLDDEIISGDPSLLGYMLNAGLNEGYDFKSRGLTGDETPNEALQHRTRGSMTADGKMASARDFGNVAAGLVAGMKGIPPAVGHAAFDAYQGGSGEPEVSRRAQAVDLHQGFKLYHDKKKFEYKW